MATPEEFHRAMAAAVQGTPYAVSPTDDGFEMRLDLDDAQWFGLLHKAGLTHALTWKVSVRPGGRYIVSNTRSKLDWVKGVPIPSLSASMVIGRTWTWSTEKVWAWEGGRFRKVVDYEFNSREGDQLIKGVGARLGLRPRLPLLSRVVLVFVAAMAVTMAVGSLFGMFE